ncbi:MAG: hypothetical protein JST47_10720 [Bacteroidetes bacterium]|nr:hypothetical protein [Bacteroidota bacterium]MBS1973495.1 hypothetical protein [Bacteroidota bacterium]
MAFAKTQMMGALGIYAAMKHERQVLPTAFKCPPAIAPKNRNYDIKNTLLIQNIYIDI